MKKYRITVGGKTYEVEVEEIEESSPQQRVEPDSVQPLEDIDQPIQESSEQIQPAEESEESGRITAPMPGKISNLSIEKGQQVSRGDNLLILEAMKLENEIRAPIAGTVQELHVADGDTVNTGDLMLVIE